MNKSDNKRIAKNTLFLYFRMIVIMVVSLYTSRIVLELLGEDNYGIYNIVGGVVVMATFITNSLSAATQRYMSFSLGKKDNNVSNILGSSLCAYAIIILLAILLAETVGLWFVNHKLTIPHGRLTAANVVYQISIITLIINVARIPFEAAVIAYEKMNFYAYLSIVETILKLLVVFALRLVVGDLLIYYAMFMMVIPLGCNVAFQVYCRRKLQLTVKFNKDKTLIRSLFSYTGWSMYGGLANIFARQGGNIVINMFFGVALNAAYGLASKVSSAVSSFINSFQIAFRPQIVKLYASGEKENLEKLCFRASLFSYYLLLVMALPISFCINDILGVWLTIVPQYTGLFCILLLSYSLIDAIQSPLIYLITATGSIKVYQLWLGSLILLNIPVSYLFLRLGFPAYVVLAVFVGINFISSIIRTIYVKYFVDFPSMKYFLQVICPSLIVTVVLVAIGYLINTFVHAGWILRLLIIFITSLPVIYILGISHQERAVIQSYIKKSKLFKR